MSATPLVDRPPGAALFLRPAGPVTAAAFLADAQRCAASLPEGGPLVNLCRDRYAFAVAFAAAMLRGRTCLLPGDAAPARLAALPGEFPGCSAITDDDGPPPPLPATLLRPAGTWDGPAPANPTIPNDRLAAIVFTSGSTGAPVAHRKSWGGLAARSRAAHQRFGLDAAAACVVGTVPPGHMYGFELTVLLPLHAAASSWCGPAFFPGDVQAALALAPAPRILVTTPLQLRALLQGMAPPPPLLCCISATAPLDPATAEAAEARWAAPVLEIFGATECGSIASRRTIEGDIWTAYPGVTVQQDQDAATVVAEGMERVALADDLELLGPGRFRLLGRRADVVKLGGRRASLSGLNRILTGLDGVADGTFLVPDDLDRRSNARLLAVVVAPNRSAPSILAELRGSMDPLFLPRRVIRVAALPRNELGKLPRQALLALLDGAERA